MTDHDDRELERLVRASLDTHAGEVDTAVPVATRARAAARPRRTRWIAVGATVAAAAAVAAVSVPVVVIDRREPGDPVVADVGLPTQWRAEYWHTISAEVPADWGWGVTPTRLDDRLIRCGEGDGAYVGRPIGTSDLCIDATGAGRFVWFGSPLEPGTEEIGRYTRQTVEVEGERVTVSSDDDSLRARILDSVRPQRLCPATTGQRGPDVGGMPTEGVGDVRTFEMCAYASGEDGSYDLVYGAALAPGDYQRWRRSTSDPPPVDLDCPSNQELVVLKGTFDDPFGTEPIPLTWVVDLPCGQVRSAYGDFVLTDDMESAWADEGVRSSLSYFIGVLG